MQRLAVLAVLLCLAACPAKKTTPVAPPEPGVGCPPASDIYTASFVQPPQGEQGYTGWALPLHNTTVQSVDGQPAWATLDPAAAAQAGVPQPPQTIWLMAPNAPLCKATIGKFYAASVPVNGAPNISYGVELTGCAGPQDPADGAAIAFVSGPPPSECRPLTPRPIANRLGQSDQKNGWSRPTTEIPIPPELAKIIPERACAAPDCEKLWSIAQVELDGKPIAWTGAVNWLEIPPGAGADTQCQWKAETFAGFFIAGPDGAPVKVTEQQSHPLVLTAVLADKGGARVLFAEGTGEYTTYQLGNGAATVGRHLVWFVDEPDAYGSNDHIGPDCNPSP